MPVLGEVRVVVGVQVRAEDYTQAQLGVTVVSRCKYERETAEWQKQWATVRIGIHNGGLNESLRQYTMRNGAHG